MEEILQEILQVIVVIMILVGRVVNGLVLLTMGHIPLAIIFIVVVLLLKFPFLLMILGRTIQSILFMVTGSEIFLPPRQKLLSQKLLEVSRPSLPGPPAGMNSEVWLSQQLSFTSMQELITKTELDAECQWRKENDEHDGCPKCKTAEMKPPAKYVAKGIRYKCDKCT